MLHRLVVVLPDLLGEHPVGCEPGTSGVPQIVVYFKIRA